MRTLALKLALVTSLLGVASLAQAQTTFNVTGTITVGTCTIAVNGGTPVNVGTFNSSLFTGTYQSGFKTFNLTYSACSQGIQTMTLKLTGTADKTTGGNASYYDSTLPGAPFELRDVTKNVVLPPSGATAITITNPGASGTYGLEAQFHQTGALTKTGAGTATVTVTAAYL